LPFARLRAVFGHGQEQYLAVRGFVPNQSLHLVGRASEDTRTSDNHVRTLLENSTERFDRIACLSHDFDIRLVGKQATQALPQQHVVVHQNAANFLIAGRSFSLYRRERVHSSSLGND
jgi:hypothetical protein